MTDTRLVFRSIDLYIHWVKFRILVAVPFIALSLVGCSSGSGSGSSATAPANSTVIQAIEGIEWDAKTYTAAAVNGKVTISLEDKSSLPHNLHLLDAENVDVGLELKVELRGDVHTDSYTLAPGTYQVICTIAGHGNMKATLTVT
jgi:plastocyanin